LDFNHSIFGVLIEGDDVRDHISRVPVNDSDRPLTDVVISSASIFADTENGVLMLKAQGSSGVADVTVTVRDAQGNTSLRTFRVTVQADTVNGGPFLADFNSDVRTTVDTPVSFQVTGIDVEGDEMFFDNQPAPDGANYNLTVNNQTGLFTFTPTNGFTGTASLLIGVRAGDNAESDTGDTFDTELVTFTVSQPGVTGTVFLDADRDGQIDAGEAGQSGWTLYVDSDNDGRMDAGEPTTTTAANGSYNFSNLPAGNHTIRLVPHVGMMATQPAFGARHITVSQGSGASNQHFGVAVQNTAPQPDFEIIDVNPNTPTSQQGISPRDYLGTVSVWYFTHST
jgi:hypothetical protein